MTPEPSPFALVGTRVLTHAAGRRPTDRSRRRRPGTILLDLGGPPGWEVVGVKIDGGRFVFRMLTDCRLLTG